jgi:septal ring factor EnvC (AmiA/AmiB activator)
MSDLNDYTPTELVKLSEDIKKKHSELKTNMLVLTKQIEDIEKIINENMSELVALEQLYFDIVTKIDEIK